MLPSPSWERMELSAECASCECSLQMSPITQLHLLCYIHITVSHFPFMLHICSLYAPFLPCPKNCPFPSGDLDPILYTAHWGHRTHHPKWHLDPFCHFSKINGHYQQTDRPESRQTLTGTKQATYTISAMQPKNLTDRELLKQLIN